MNSANYTRPIHHQQFVHTFLPTIPQLSLTNKLFGVSKTEPRLAILVLNRLAYGATPDDLAAFEALGATDESRLRCYIDQQLNPKSPLDESEYLFRLAQANFETLDQPLSDLWQTYCRHDGAYTRKTLSLREVERLIFLRAVYSKRQLVEILAEFWHNHFNIYAWGKSQIAAIFIHYDRDVIRKHMLGNFRELLTAVYQSPEMLYYQDNPLNVVNGPNLTLAKTLLDVHTLGLENYLGQLNQADVPQDSKNRPIGYVDADVWEAARCLTGWGVADDPDDRFGDTGQFAYRHKTHDCESKEMLGLSFFANQPPLKDGHDLLDLVATHPATARHIAKKLCRRFIGDYPPEAVVSSAAKLFLLLKDDPNQLREVVRHILLAPAFRESWGQKQKRPFELIVSALRATKANFTLKYGDADSNSFMWRYDQIGHAPFAAQLPNGYADTKDQWENSTSLVMRWRMVNWLIEKKTPDGQYRLNILEQTPEACRTAEQLVDFWIDRIVEYQMEPSDRQIMVDFMAQEKRPFAPLDLTDKQVQERLQAMVGLILNSPQFQQK